MYSTATCENRSFSWGCARLSRNNSIANCRDAQASLWLSDRRQLWWLLIGFGRLQCTSINDDSDWPVSSLLLSLHDCRCLSLRWLPSTVPCSMVFGSVQWRQTWPNHDNMRCLMVDGKNFWRPARSNISAAILLYHVLFSKAWIRLSRSELSHSRAILIRLVIYRVCSLQENWWFCFCQSTAASLVMAERAHASLIFTFFTDVPSVVCAAPKYLNCSTYSTTFPFIHMLVDGLGLMLLTRILLLSKLILIQYKKLSAPVFRCLLGILIGCPARRKIAIVSKLKVANRSSSDGLYMYFRNTYYNN